ncbi:MAG: hypothetical protein KAX65_01840 [Caldilineaceae bacterium]|nr:hypothetical protein [Caldilineaceae bacterium]
MSEIASMTPTTDKIILAFDVRGQLRKGINNKLRERGKQYCAGCKQVLAVGDFYPNVNLCKLCVKKRPSYVRSKAKTGNNIKREYLTRKIWAVNLLGGKCCRCQYDESIVALEFHHVYPSQRSFELSEMFKTRAFTNDDMINELKKCALLCSNCHASRHANHWKGTFVKRDEGIGWTLKSSHE